MAHSTSPVPSHRAYRRLSPRTGERSFQVVVEESDLWITVVEDAPAGVESLALETVHETRAVIKRWMLIDPAFGTSLVPLPEPLTAPSIIRRMCRAAAVMQVGPMATVAGAVADAVATALRPGSPDCIVENGGDCMMHSSRERLVALLPDPSGAGMLGLRLSATDFPLSICASSAVIGHSFSFGKGELAVARSRDPFLADAAATALCNRLSGPEAVGSTVEYAASLESEGLDGVFLQCGGTIGVWGRMELAAL